MRTPITARTFRLILKSGLLVAMSYALLLVSGCSGRGVAGPEAPVLITALASPNPGVVHADAAQAPSNQDKPEKITFDRAGAGTWSLAKGKDPVAGNEGRLLRYQVAVERGIRGVSANEFATAVVATLADRRSWAAQGEVRLQRVGPGRAHDFTIRLVTPTTRDYFCGGTPDGYTSCRNGDNVVINVARWAEGVPDYGAPLSVYRSYVINHETGHRLGHAHELCPAPGRLAPVMEQQSLGLHGCRANGWPTVKGKPYRGKLGQYNDPVPDGYR
jgi:hypothetical protein